MLSFAGIFTIRVYDKEGRSTIPHPNKPQDCPWCYERFVSDSHIGLCTEWQAEREIQARRKECAEIGALC